MNDSEDDDMPEDTYLVKKFRDKIYGISASDVTVVVYGDAETANFISTALEKRDGGNNG